jgi:hypothetical protein
MGWPEYEFAGRFRNFPRKPAEVEPEPRGLRRAAGLQRVLHGIGRSSAERQTVPVLTGVERGPQMA